MRFQKVPHYTDAQTLLVQKRKKGREGGREVAYHLCILKCKKQITGGREDIVMKGS